MTVTSFLTHTQHKKLEFSETVLSFAVKVKLWHLSVFSFAKLWQGLNCTRVVRLTAVVYQCLFIQQDTGK